MWEYTGKVKDHFLNPRNVGEVENPDGVAEVGSIACGDALKFTFKLDENKKIKEAKFKTFGCASAIASASALTEMVKGKTLEEARNISNQDIAEYLGGLPEEKMHCSVLGQQALEKAIQSYQGAPAAEPGAEIICECFGITDREIEKAVKENHLTTVEQVTNYTKAGGGCGNCHEKIRAIIDRVLATGESAGAGGQAEADEPEEDQADRRCAGAGDQAFPAPRRRRHRADRRRRQQGDRGHARQLRHVPRLPGDPQGVRGNEAAGRLVSPDLTVEEESR